jgi:hypothetical protein
MQLEFECEFWKELILTFIRGTSEIRFRNPSLLLTHGFAGIFLRRANFLNALLGQKLAYHKHKNRYYCDFSDDFSLTQQLHFPGFFLIKELWPYY